MLIMRTLAVVVIVGSLVGGCAHINKKAGLPNNNPIEEFLEDVIEQKSGIRTNLSGDPVGEKDL